MQCTLNYIPVRLHTNQKQIIEEFQEGEKLYYRCKSGECKKPYDRISLYDISHNRNFADEAQFPPSDVLFNIIEEDTEELYDLKVTELLITNLGEDSTYNKSLVSIDDESLIAEIKLKHCPVPCMYPHSVFEISINGVIVNKHNYKNVLNKKNVKYKNLRYDIRQELTSIIQTKKIDSTNDIEMIGEEDL